MGLVEQLKLAFACAGIFFSFSFAAVKQEDLYKVEYGEGDMAERFRFTFFALAAERGINAGVALLGVLLIGGSGVVIAHGDIFRSGISQMLAMAASNEALRYVSYATQVLGKSCKMVPVMLGGILLSGKRYETAKYLQAAARPSARPPRREAHATRAARAASPHRRPAAPHARRWRS